MDDLKLFDNIGKVLDHLPVKCAAIAVNFTKERCRTQHGLDKTPEPWKPRTRRTGRKSDNRAILTKSGRLRRSIRRTGIGSNYFEIGTDVEYAKIHNDGGNIDNIQNIKSHSRCEHTRKAYARKDGKKIKQQRIKKYTVKAYKRHIRYTMPKRQFIGQSDALNKRMFDFIRQDFISAIKKHIKVK